MKKTITSGALNVFKSAFAEWGRDAHVSLYQQEHFGQDDILEYKVNWSALGDQTVEETYRFVQSLQLAAKIADEINSAQYEVCWSSDLSIRTKEAYWAEVKLLSDALSEGRWSFVTRWLDDHRIA